MKTLKTTISNFFILFLITPHALANDQELVLSFDLDVPPIPGLAKPFVPSSFQGSYEKAERKLNSIPNLNDATKQAFEEANMNRAVDAYTAEVCQSEPPHGETWTEEVTNYPIPGEDGMCFTGTIDWKTACELRDVVVEEKIVQKIIRDKSTILSAKGIKGKNPQAEVSISAIVDTRGNYSTKELLFLFHCECSSEPLAGDEGSIHPCEKANESGVQN